MSFRRFISLACVLLPVAAPALADPQSLSTNVPVPVQDALATKRGTLTLQGTSVYTRDDFNRKGCDLLQLSPTVKLGVAKGVQLDFTMPYAVGNQSSANQGYGAADLFYQFTEPSPTMPALAIQGGYRFFEFGPGLQSDQWFLRAAVTQWFGSNDKSPRLHLNLDWTHIPRPGNSNRSDVMEIGLAYSQLVSSSTALVLDVVHGAKTAKGQDETVFDIGLRHEFNDEWAVSAGNDEWAVSAGIGAGVFQESPAFRVLFGIQRNFHLF
jgi:hypothetical protein